MRKVTVGLSGVTVGMLAGCLVSLGLPFAFAQPGSQPSYAEERASIENLQARYLFALDFKDHDLYVTTFTPNGILDVGSGEIVGREAIKAAVANMPGGRSRESGRRVAIRQAADLQRRQSGLGRATRQSGLVTTRGRRAGRD